MARQLFMSNSSVTSSSLCETCRQQRRSVTQRAKRGVAHAHMGRPCNLLSFLMLCVAAKRVLHAPCTLSLVWCCRECISPAHKRVACCRRVPLILALPALSSLHRAAKGSWAQRASSWALPTSSSRPRLPA